MLACSRQHWHPLVEVFHEIGYAHKVPAFPTHGLQESLSEGTVGPFGALLGIFSGAT